jgi:hypothetical protein
MTDRPILFSAAMVNALLQGRKTQTRRAIKIKGYPGHFQFGRSDTPGYDWTFRRADHIWEDFKHDRFMTLLPIQIGNRLWVRESITRAETDQGEGYMTYAADGKDVWPLTRWHHQHNNLPSIHMPRWASRLTLTVTDVRIERLNNISEADAQAEGATMRPNSCGFLAQDPGWSMDWSRADKHELPHSEISLCDPQMAFASYWNDLNGPGAWDENPWVAAYTFTIEKRNIDE